MPKVEERLLHWEQTMPKIVKLSEDISIKKLATRYELSGASILNVLHISTIRALASDNQITKSIVIDEIKKEYAKENRTL